MKLKSPHFDKLKSLTKKQKKLILAGIALFLLIHRTVTSERTVDLQRRDGGAWYVKGRCY